MRNFKPRTVQTGKTIRIVIQPGEYKGEPVVQVAKQYSDRHSGSWEYARGGFNVKVDDWADFVKAVNLVKI